MCLKRKKTHKIQLLCVRFNFLQVLIAFKKMCTTFFSRGNDFVIEDYENRTFLIKNYTFKYIDIQLQYIVNETGGYARTHVDNVKFAYN